MLGINIKNKGDALANKKARYVQDLGGKITKELSRTKRVNCRINFRWFMSIQSKI